MSQNVSSLTADYQGTVCLCRSYSLYAILNLRSFSTGRQLLKIEKRIECIRRMVTAMVYTATYKAIIFSFRNAIY